MSAHLDLRNATRGAHDRVDAIFSRLTLSDRDDYVGFLRSHAAAFLPAEQALGDAGAANLIADWDRMTRGSALAADLRDLGVDLPRPLSAPQYTDEAALLGGAYVLEGSRIGGAVLRRQVGEGLPKRFLDSLQPPGRWRAFIAALDRRLYDTPSVNRAIQSALATFALFEQSEAGRSK